VHDIVAIAVRDPRPHHVFFERREALAQLVRVFHDQEERRADILDHARAAGVTGTCAVRIDVGCQLQQAGQGGVHRRAHAFQKGPVNRAARFEHDAAVVDDGVAGERQVHAAQAIEVARRGRDHRHPVLQQREKRALGRRGV
jgi:hypothetical protein